MDFHLEYVYDEVYIMKMKLTDYVKRIGKEYGRDVVRTKERKLENARKMQ